MSPRGGTARPQEPDGMGGSACERKDTQSGVLWYRRCRPMAARRRGVNHPAGRIRDHRRAGHRIDTQQTKDRGEDGRVVTVALYELRPPKQLSILEVLSKGA